MTITGRRPGVGFHEVNTSVLQEEYIPRDVELPATVGGGFTEGTLTAEGLDGQVTLRNSNDISFGFPEESAMAHFNDKCMKWTADGLVLSAYELQQLSVRERQAARRYAKYYGATEVHCLGCMSEEMGNAPRYSNSLNWHVPSVPSGIQFMGSSPMEARYRDYYVDMETRVRESIQPIITEQANRMHDAFQYRTRELRRTGEQGLDYQVVADPMESPF